MTVIPIQQLHQNDVLQFLKSIGECRNGHFQWGI